MKTLLYVLITKKTAKRGTALLQLELPYWKSRPQGITCIIRRLYGFSYYWLLAASCPSFHCNLHFFYYFQISIKQYRPQVKIQSAWCYKHNTAVIKFYTRLLKELNFRLSESFLSNYDYYIFRFQFHSKKVIIPMHCSNTKILKACILNHYAHMLVTYIFRQHTKLSLSLF